jgi:hypothetical protein
MQDADPVCGFSKTGASYRVPDSVAGLRPSAWTKGEGRSYLPRPSTLHGRGPDTEHRAEGPAIWHLGPGTRHRSRSDAEGRTPSTEDRARPLKNAPTGFASCILHPFLNKAVVSRHLCPTWQYGNRAVRPTIYYSSLPSLLDILEQTPTPLDDARFHRRSQSQVH